MAKHIITIDQGTSGTKVLLFDEKGRFVHRCDRSHNQFYPQNGWVEHDAIEIFNNTVSAIDELISETNVSADDIIALSIANQRETVVVFDRKTGEPVSNAVVWQCNRATESCREILDKGYAQLIFEKTGLVLSPYYSGAKIKWILDNIDGAREKAEKGDLAFSTIDSWLIYKLTGGKIHATEYSNASRTQLLNITTLEFDKELLEIFDIPQSMMPEVYSSDHIFGEIEVSCLKGHGVKITGVMGDSHAALFGQNCFSRGMAKVTYGTGSSIMMNIGSKPYLSEKGLVTSIGWGIGNEIVYVAEGNINCSAATIKWLVDDLELIPDSKCTEEISESIENNAGIYLVPAFVGFGTPYWDSEATAMITGMTRGTKKAHLVRAATESIGYQVRDIIDIMVAEADVKLKEIRVDGGASRNNFIMQFQSDILGCNVVANHVEEICAIGTAYMAGIAVGLFSIDELHKLRTQDVCYTPQMDEETKEKNYDGWKRAVMRALHKF